MSVNRQLFSLEDLRNYLDIKPTDVAFAVYCNAGDATAATIKIQRHAVTLTITGGVYAGTNILDYHEDNPARATWNTLGELADYINALDGWFGDLYGTSGDESTTLADLATTDILGEDKLLFVGTTNNRFRANRLNDLLQLLVNGVTKYVENYIKRTLSYEETTRYLDGPGTEVLVLPDYPISSLDAIYVDSNRSFGDETEEDSDNYYVDDTAGRIEKLNGIVWPAGRRNIKITYTKGFSSIPDDLRLAGLEVAAIKWNESHQGDKRIGVIQSTLRFSEESQTNTFLRTELPKPTQDVLNKYRKIAIFG